MFQLEGKRAVVTGGSSGIGQTIAVAVAKPGASVAILDIDGTGAARTERAVRATERDALFIPTAVADPDQVEAGATTVVDRWGGLDIWVNNAARLLVSGFLEMTHDDWHRLLAVNLHGYFYGARSAARRMVAQRSGRIVNVTSVTRTQPHPPS